MPVIEIDQTIKYLAKLMSYLLYAYSFIFLCTIRLWNESTN